MEFIDIGKLGYVVLFLVLLMLAVWWITTKLKPHPRQAEREHLTHTQIFN
jgi:hypothetical protein